MKKGGVSPKWAGGEKNSEKRFLVCSGARARCLFCCGCRGPALGRAPPVGAPGGVELFSSAAGSEGCVVSVLFAAFAAPHSRYSLTGTDPQKDQTRPHNKKHTSQRRNVVHPKPHASGNVRHPSETTRALTPTRKILDQTRQGNVQGWLQGCRGRGAWWSRTRCHGASKALETPSWTGLEIESVRAAEAPSKISSSGSAAAKR